MIDSFINDEIYLLKLIKKNIQFSLLDVISFLLLKNRKNILCKKLI
jgi:hypothetical protein